MPPVPLDRLDLAVRRIRDHVGTRAARGMSHDAADDTVGTIDCDDAVGFAPMHLLEALDRHGARAVVIGQVAGIMHGSQELTGDLDLLWSGAPSERPKVAAAFADVEASLFADDDAALAVTPAAFALPKVLFHSSGASGDCCTPALPWGSVDVVGVMDRAESVSRRDVTVHYAPLADLVAMRRATGRPKDVRRAAELSRLAVSFRRDEP
jgi:hypothetical protein